MISPLGQLTSPLYTHCAAKEATRKSSHSSHRRTRRISQKPGLSFDLVSHAALCSLLEYLHPRRAA
jgi:hypothetical protein